MSPSPAFWNEVVAHRSSCCMHRSLSARGGIEESFTPKGFPCNKRVTLSDIVFENDGTKLAQVGMAQGLRMS